MTEDEYEELCGAISRLDCFVQYAEIKLEELEKRIRKLERRKTKNKAPDQRGDGKPSGRDL